MDLADIKICKMLIINVFYFANSLNSYAQISYILCKEMASYWRKKQKTDANVTSVIIVVAHVFLERKPMAGLFQNDFLLCWMT